MEKILIAENTQQADKAIDQAKEFIKSLNDLINYYNELPIIAALDTREKVVNFLNDKINYFHNSILNDTGISFANNIKPLPAKIAEMYAIPYIETINRFSQYRYVDLNTVDFDPIKHTFTLKPETISEFYEKAKTYTKTQKEAEALIYLRNFCDALNDYADRFKLTTFDIHHAAKYLAIDTPLIKGKATFSPNYRRLTTFINNAQ